MIVHDSPVIYFKGKSFTVSLEQFNEMMVIILGMKDWHLAMASIKSR